MTAFGTNYDWCTALEPKMTERRTSEEDCVIWMSCLRKRRTHWTVRQAPELLVWRSPASKILLKMNSAFYFLFVIFIGLEEHRFSRLWGGNTALSRSLKRMELRPQPNKPPGSLNPIGEKEPSTSIVWFLYFVFFSSSTLLWNDQMSSVWVDGWVLPPHHSSPPTPAHICL